MRFAACCTVLFSILAAANAQASPTKRTHIDDADFKSFKSVKPRAAELLEQGEEQMQKGQLAEAAETLERAWKEHPYPALIARRRCQVLNALGRREEALKACSSALSSKASPMDLRTVVNLRLSEPGLASPGVIVEALKYTKQAKTYGRDEPWGYAAECDIAARIGDEAMFRKCLAELERISPDHYETRRARSMISAPSPALLGIGWALIGLAFVATCAHALRRFFRGRLRGTAAATAAMLAALTLSLPARAENASAAPSSAPAPGPAGPSGKQGLSIWPIDHNDPEKSVPTLAQRDSNPLDFGYHLQDLITEGERATRLGDYRAAIKYYRAVAKAVPDRTTGYSKACKLHEMLGEREDALQWCGTAVSKFGATLDDFQRFSRVTLSKQDPLTEVEKYNLEDAITHIKQQKDAPAIAAAELMQCELGMKTGDLRHLQECQAALVQRAPNDATTIYYEWALALKLRDFSEANRHLARAKKAQAKPETVAHMETATAELRNLYWRKRLLLGAGGLFGVGLSVFGVEMLLRWRRSRQRFRFHRQSR
jgi:tetratricopeptide (TPR) repeat protein